MVHMLSKANHPSSAPDHRATTAIITTMPPVEAGPNSAKASSPEKRQPWKDHWHALAATNSTGDGTSHGFERGEQVIMDGNMIMDRDADDKKSDDTKKKDDAKKRDDAKKKGDAEKKGGNEDKEKQ
ncbi:hypothetical protein PG993_005592 [Apiospora rasikravindrae]|uniref:Hypervirulence associated protein TUDOR domain-containing protein n=1 Tax=Apiospora rasikravindrae TaxID=990691 RepID=A0ABR1TG12_9PEZI